VEEKESDKSSIILTAQLRLVDARRAAALCSISARFWAKLDASGKVPSALKLGRRSLWSVKELDDWIAKGCPERSRWAEMRKKK